MEAEDLLAAKAASKSSALPQQKSVTPISPQAREGSLQIWLNSPEHH